MEAGLAASLHENQTHETGAGKQKERGLFNCWSPEKMGDFYPNPILAFSVQAGVFVRRERVSKQRGQEEGLWTCSSPYGPLMSAYWSWSPPANSGSWVICIN